MGYLVAPNSAVALWDSNSPTIYLKQADASGKPSTGGEAGDGDGPRQVTVGDRTLCEDTPVESNTDDWNGYRAKPLASTGTAVLGLAGGALAVLLAGGSLLVFRKRHYAQGSGRHTAVNAGK